MKQKTTTRHTVTATVRQKSGKQSFYINPLTDFGFKKLFCSDCRGAARLLDLLKTFLPDKMEGVTSITFLPTELLGDSEDTKRVSFDIYGITNDEKRIIVEMQRGEQTFFANRVITYNCRVISQNVVRGDLEYNIPMVISFSIMDYTPKWFSKSDEFFHIVQLKDEKNKIFSQKTFFCFLELRTFAAPTPGMLKDKVFPDRKRKWAYVLKNMGEMKEQDLSQEDEIIRGLFEDGRYSKLTVMEKKQYRKSVLEYADVQDAIRCAQQNSLEEGREQGREEGREEALRQAAKKFLEMGISIEDVAKATGLDVEILRGL